MKNKCKHKWIDMEDGTFDQFCVRCSLKQMQNVMSPISAELNVPLGMSLEREKIEVPLFTGDKHIRISVYKDELIKQMNEEIGLSINHFSNSIGR